MKISTSRTIDIGGASVTTSISFEAANLHTEENSAQALAEAIKFFNKSEASNPLTGTFTVKKRASDNARMAAVEE